MEKQDNMKEQMGNGGRETETLKIEPKRNVRNQNTVTKIRNASDGLINRLDMAEERICEFKDRSIETSKMGIKRGKKEWKNRTSKNCEKIPKSVQYE